MTPEWIYLVSLLICFCGSGFFSMAETALTSLSPHAIEKLSERESWFYNGIRAWGKIPNRLLATNLAGNTLVNTALAVIAGAYVVNYRPFIQEAVLTLVLTLLILIFGEIGPKMMARTYPENIAPVVSRILLTLNYIFYPFTYLITRFISFVLGLFGIFLNVKKRIRADEIEHMVMLARSQGGIEQDKSEILSSVFDFSKKRVKEIMIPREDISSIDVNAPLMDVLDMVRQENHSRYPVYRGSLDQIIGFLHARDLFGVLKTYGFSDGGNPPLNRFSLRTCLRRAFFVSESAMISSVLNEMKKRRIHLAIVKDEWGNVVGLVTLEDILEEVFGEIEDEHDERIETNVKDLYESGVEVDGTITLNDLESKYDIELEDSDSYTTLNGFLHHYAAHQRLTPKTVIIWQNYVFSILEVKDSDVERVKITMIPEEED